MKKNLRVLIVTLIFAALIVSFITSDKDAEEPKDVDPRAKIAGIIQKAGIPLSDLILTNGEQAKLGLNITDVDIPDDHNVAVVIYATPGDMKKYVVANTVIYTCLDTDETIDGVILFDVSRRMEAFLSRTFIYANRTSAEGLREAGLDDAKIFNNWRIFTVSEAQVMGAGRALLETLYDYEIQVGQADVVKGAVLKSNLQGIGGITDEANVAFVSFMPPENQEDAYISLITEIGFEVDPSIDYVLIIDNMALQKEDMISIYYTDRDTFEDMDFEDLDETISRLTLVEYQWSSGDGTQE